MTDLLEAVKDPHMSNQFDRTADQRAEHARLVAQAFNEGVPNYRDAQAIANALMFEDFAKDVQRASSKRFANLFMEEPLADGNELMARSRQQVEAELVVLDQAFEEQAMLRALTRQGAQAS